jgi:hypothetical protein
LGRKGAVSATETYTIPTAYVAPASLGIDANELFRLVVRRIVDYCREHPSRLAALIQYVMAIHDDPAALRQALRDALAPERRVTTPKRGGAIVVVCPPSLQSAGVDSGSKRRGAKVLKTRGGWEDGAGSISAFVVRGT